MRQTPSGNPVVLRGERGFALLIVFLMAAAVAVMLYRQIPRVAFESQRDKEQLLIEHGEQYKRAIQLYFVAFKKYPSKIEDLENTNDKRFLRRRYVDPMTGKDEWRLIHVNAAGVLTDSVVQKPAAPGAPGANGAPGTGGAPGATVSGITPSTGAGTTGGTGSGSAAGTAANGASGVNTPPEVNAAVLRRPSDRPLAPGAPGTNPATVDPNDPRYWPAITLLPPAPPGAPARPGQPGSNPVQGVNPAQGVNPQVPGQSFFGQQVPGQAFPGQTFPGQQQPGGQLNPGQQFPPQQFPTATGQPVPPQAIPGQQGTLSGLTSPQGSGVNTQPASTLNQNGPGPGAPNAALSMINTMLTTPRQPPPTPDSSTNNPVNAGGLAGVASTFKGPSIKIYNDRQKYNEWEFIFDLKQGLPGQPPPPANTAQPNASGVNSPGGANNPGAGPGQPSSGSGFGTGNTFTMPLSPAPSSSAPAQQ